MIRSINKIKSTVEKLLIEFPETRDNDNLLIMKVWLLQAPDLRNTGVLFRDFAVPFVEGTFACAESIRRSRALLQANNVELRGENYKKRHQLAEETRELINN